MDAPQMYVRLSTSWPTVVTSLPGFEQSTSTYVVSHFSRSPLEIKKNSAYLTEESATSDTRSLHRNQRVSSNRCNSSEKNALTGGKGQGVSGDDDEIALPVPEWRDKHAVTEPYYSSLGTLPSGCGSNDTIPPQATIHASDPPPQLDFVAASCI